MISAFYTENRKLWKVAGGGAGRKDEITKQTCLWRYRNNILPDLQSEFPSIHTDKARST